MKINEIIALALEAPADSIIYVSVDKAGNKECLDSLTITEINGQKPAEA